MKENIAIINNLHHLMDYDARKFITAETVLKNSLHNWINTAGSLKLKTVLQKYFDYVQQHIQKMEEFYKEEAIVTAGLTNRVMPAFIADAEEKLENCTDPTVKDACLLACVQAINHYKISAYGTAAAFANALELEKHAVFFREAAVNEKQIDDRLSQLAEHEINTSAKMPGVLHQ
ncbi:MAG: hypothetical protein JWR61_2469 [Ferruginibacter sp.]|uniref:YciE/YciF ferroxidase family protein n=1 Tax=Ferruginibacter sp. TaxID=1940288 RepID=UPI002659D1A2|nr:DUF892 family protein [Ferruginibacter sp.]MDB5277514.1 hypothetical protein [Ferruginibacter sp.]